MGCAFRLIENMGRFKKTFIILLVLVSCFLCIRIGSSFFGCNRINYINFGLIEAPFEEIEHQTERVSAVWKYETSDVESLVTWLFASPAYQEDHGDIDYDDGLARAIRARPRGGIS